MARQMAHHVLHWATHLLVGARVGERRAMRPVSALLRAARQLDAGLLDAIVSSALRIDDAVLVRAHGAARDGG